MLRRNQNLHRITPKCANSECSQNSINLSIGPGSNPSIFCKSHLYCICGERADMCEHCIQQNCKNKKYQGEQYCLKHTTCRTCNNIKEKCACCLLCGEPRNMMYDYCNSCLDKRIPFNKERTVGCYCRKKIKNCKCQCSFLSCKTPRLEGRALCGGHNKETDDVRGYIIPPTAGGSRTKTRKYKKRKSKKIKKNKKKSLSK